jgi:uncharacterized membrane protein
MISSKDLLSKENDSENRDDLNGGKRLDNDQMIFVLGILSIFLFIPIGSLMAMFSIVRANEELDEFKISPEEFNLESFELVRRGRILGIVALSIHIVSLLLFLAFYL